MSITVIGTIFTDVKGYPLGDFIPDGRNPGVMKIVHGGVARNVAEDLGRIGLSPVFVGLSDRSAIASDVTARLKTSGVDTRFVFPTETGMGTWMAIFNEKGDVAANISIRPDLSPLTGLLDAHHREIFADADSIILEIDIEPETVEKVFYYASIYGKKVYALVSVMGIALKRRKYFPLTECFVCNLQEAEMMFGEDLAGLELDALKERIAFLAKEAGFSKLIVTLGERGAVYTDCHAVNDSVNISNNVGAGTADSGAADSGAAGSGLAGFGLADSGTAGVGTAGSGAAGVGTAGSGLAAIQYASGYCPAKKVTLIDSTGAGDSFCAGAAAALTSGMGLDEACRIGNRLAASVITSTENVCPIMDSRTIGL